MQKQFLACCFGLSILGASLIRLNSAIAKPAAIFQPLIEDIRQQVPQGLVMRLPASFPSQEIYPYVKSDSESLTVNLAITPDCVESNNPTSCTAIILGVYARDDSQNWPPEGDNITPVELSNNIVGYYFTRGKEDSLSQYVVWQQDEGLRYGVVGAAILLSQEQLFNIAKSMVQELPLESAK